MKKPTKQSCNINGFILLRKVRGFSFFLHFFLRMPPLKWHSTAVEEAFLNCCTRSAKLIVKRSRVKGCPPHFTFEPAFFCQVFGIAAEPVP